MKVSRTPISVRSLAALTLATAVLVMVPATGGQAAGGHSASDQPARGPRQRVVVTFEPNSSARTRADAVVDSGTLLSEFNLPSGTGPRRRTDARTGRSMAVMAVTPGERDDLLRDPAVAAVVDDVVVHADATPDDPGYAQATGLRQVGVPAAWDITVGDPDLVVAIIDTGIEYADPDFAGRTVPGYDFVNGDADPEDDHGHGTAVAGVAAATADNGTGVAGVCWTCRIMPIKVLGDDGSGYLGDAAQGIAWAVEHGADVVNLSLSGTARLSAMDAAVSAATDAGVLVVASAGNAATSTEHWPAAHPSALAVAALDGSTRASYSNHGSWVDIAAPGCNPANDLGAGTRNFCGTSSSAPLVAGVAALALAANPDLDAHDVRDILTSTADPLPGGLGAGRIAAGTAVATADSLRAPGPDPQDDPQDGPGDGETPAPATPPDFGDIAGNVHAGNITTLAGAGITSGCTPTRYCPASRVTRGQMASLLDRALDLPAGDAQFGDVPADHPHAAGIAAVAAAGITNGCAPDRFCPGARLTRGQMASLLDRALDLPAGDAQFGDVPAGHPHASGIAALAAAGITNGCTPGSFCPDATVNRGQMASFLVRALGL